MEANLAAATREYLDRLGIVLDRRPLERFWPKGGPQWDGLGLTEAGEPVLIEAKSHVRELCSPPSAASARSLKRIRLALDEAARELHAHAASDWTRCFYQYTNRLAHAVLLCKLNGVRAHLVFLHFIGDREMHGPGSRAEWEAALHVLRHALGLPSRLPPCV